MSKRDLTDKQLRFIEAYKGNATDAARKAGYEGSDETLAVVGYENLRKPQIAQAIRERGDAEREARIATRVKRQAFWTKVMQDKKADFAARLRASELLGKSEGDFIDRHEHSGPNGKPIQIQATEHSDEELEARIQLMLEKGKQNV